MHVISKTRLTEFARKHPDSLEALLAWHKLMDRHAISNFAQMRAMFGSVDLVGEWHVFDIRGNRYRLICDVVYGARKCFIKHVLTHAEYDRGKWK
jgi:mRNA interferase HigB